MEQEIKKLFYELGIPVFLKKTQESPNCITYHYEVGDIKSLGQVEKKVKMISAFLNEEIVYKKSNTSHFALSVPKTSTNMVKLQDKRFKGVFDGSFKFLAGLDDDNNPYIIDLDKIPHILVAGTTGSGKSVLLNSIICSLLKQKNYKLSFAMIDTKRVELSPYKQLGNDWCSVAVNAIDAIEMLKDVCDNLDARYSLMEANGWRQMPDNYYREIVVIEELGDLMMVSKCVVEKFIVKLAQLGRACGIHLIIATQRPTVDVVTGAIKANIGCRFALQTTSAIDSRNILGHNGAERLRGGGDCLLKLPDRADEIHIQCPFVSDKDIDGIIKSF